MSISSVSFQLQIYSNVHSLLFILIRQAYNSCCFFCCYQISALYGAMYLLEFHVASVGALLLPILTDFLSKKLTGLTG